MENEGLTAYKNGAYKDRKEFLNPAVFDSELLTITNAKYVNTDLVVEFQKVNGRSVLYTFPEEHTQREFMADVVGYYLSNPYPQSFMRPEKMLGKRVEGFFDKNIHSLVSVAPIFSYSYDKKPVNNLRSRVLNDKEGKESPENKSAKRLDEIQDSTSYEPDDPNLHNSEYPLEDSEHPLDFDSFNPDNFYDPEDPNLHPPEYPREDRFLEDMFGGE